MDTAGAGNTTHAVNPNASDAPKSDSRLPNTGKVYPHSRHPHVHTGSYHETNQAARLNNAQWVNMETVDAPSEWNALGLEPGAQLFFGPEFDEATINELGQLLWTPESDSGVAPNANSTASSMSGWISHSPDTY